MGSHIVTCASEKAHEEALHIVAGEDDLITVSEDE
jgi:hypothetical protein